jgi:hypothetical protein
MCGEPATVWAITTPRCEDEQDESCITGANHAMLCRKHADASLMSVLDAVRHRRLRKKPT